MLHCAPKTRIYKNLHLKRLRTEFPLRLTTRVRDIQKTDIIRFLTQYNHLSAAGWNSILTVVRDVFRYAVDDGVIARSPAESIKYRKREDKQKRLIPSQKEFEQIVEHVRSQRFSDTAKASADLIEFMGLAGLGQPRFGRGAIALPATSWPTTTAAKRTSGCSRCRTMNLRS